MKFCLSVFHHPDYDVAMLHGLRANQHIMAKTRQRKAKKPLSVKKGQNISIVV